MKRMSISEVLSKRSLPWWANRLDMTLNELLEAINKPHTFSPSQALIIERETGIPISVTDYGQWWSLW